MQRQLKTSPTSPYAPWAPPPANANINGLSIKGEVSARNMGDMETAKGTLKNTEIDNKGFAVGFIGGHPNGVDIELFKRDLTLQGIYTLH
ncbi:hypothetical protein [Fibrobacter sp. UBA4297]|uniref:hypothetical protein n=1 Tax=Fibrobacter sp. UBA4297 TaxID=1946536 RepID=UPI0025C01DD4|nr:hypothetical protein [Fibrobacter sp. UBA4297]